MAASQKKKAPAKKAAKKATFKPHKDSGKDVPITASRAKTATATLALDMARTAGRHASANALDYRERVLVEQAIAVHAAYQSGLLGGSRKPGESAAMTQDDYAKVLGVSQPRISNLRTLGHALVVVGVEPKGEQWRRTVDVAGKIGKKVQSLGDDTAKSKGSLKSAVDALLTPDGKRRPAKKGTTGNGADTNALFEKAFSASNAVDAFERVVAFAAGRVQAGRVNATGLTSLEDAMVGLQEAIDTFREEGAKEEKATA